MNKILLERDTFRDRFTLGTLYLSEKPIGFTCEDTDRYLEENGVKIHGQTAIPRGRYQVVLSMSNRFKRIMPELLNVPDFTGVRIHAGNTHLDTDGCPLLGAVRTSDGVRDCKLVNEQLIEFLRHAESRKELTFITVR